MKPLIFALALLLPVPAFAQTPNDDAIAKTWNEDCNLPGLEATGSLAMQLKARGQSTWRTGSENCEAVKQAYLKSKAGIDAKAAADAEAARKARVDAIAAQLAIAAPLKK